MWIKSVQFRLLPICRVFGGEPEHAQITELLLHVVSLSVLIDKDVLTEINPELRQCPELEGVCIWWFQMYHRVV